MQTDLEIKVQKRLQSMQKLDHFAGIWNTRGITAKNELLEASDSYVWLKGGYFLIHQWNAILAGQDVSGIEIIGFDSQDDTYFTQAYDSIGNIVKYKAAMIGNIWKIWGDTEKFSGEFSRGNTIMSGQWELLTNGAWKNWMSIELHKIK